MLESFGKYTQGQYFSTRQRFVARDAISQHAREVGHLSQPPPIFLSLGFNAEIHLGLFDI